MASTVLCALADDDCVADVVAAGRAVSAVGGLEPVFVHVVAPPSAPLPGLALSPGALAAGAAVRAAGESPYLDERSREHVRAAGRGLLREAGIDERQGIVAEGEPLAEINRLAGELDAALIVAGTHGRGALAGALLGSVSRALTHHGTRPVLLARGAPLPSGTGPVVCAVDVADRGAERTAGQASALAARLGRPLVLAHVLQTPAVEGAAAPFPVPTAAADPGEQERAAVLRELEDLAGRAGAQDAECTVLTGAPVAARVDELAVERLADVLVVGCRGAGVLRTAIGGSVSHDLACHGRRPLVVVPPPCVESPEEADAVAAP